MAEPGKSAQHGVNMVPSDRDADEFAEYLHHKATTANYTVDVQMEAYARKKKKRKKRKAEVKEERERERERDRERK
eukprot:4621300-Karenia_brevis.AAC.1